VSNLSMQCCCELEPPDCSGACECATSYSVDSIAFPYRYQREVDFGSNWNCNTCPSQALCSTEYHEMNMSVALFAPFTITRTAAPECCYVGTGTVVVTGTLKLGWIYDCGISPRKEVEVDYSFERTTCVCVTVTCQPGPPGTAAVWVVQIEVGDFIVTCTHDQWFTGDCDTPWVYPLPTPVAIRCGGGSVRYEAPLRCLDTLFPSEFTCGGYSGQRPCPVGDPCFDIAGGANPRGPFGSFFEEECSTGQDDDPCLDRGSAPVGFYSLMENLLPPGVSQPKDGVYASNVVVCNGTVRVDTSQAGCATVVPIQFS
jgi:hypothetical protein